MTQLKAPRRNKTKSTRNKTSQTDWANLRPDGTRYRDRPGSTVCKHLNEPFECTVCRTEATARIYIPSAHPIETAWLLEFPTKHGPLWLAIVEGTFHWTAGAETAIRFARQEDAERMATLSRWELSGLIATEHQFG